MSRLIDPLVVFECNASVLANAMNVSTERVLLLPHNDHLMITNVGGVFTIFNLMSKECFFKYDMSLEIEEEWLKKQIITDLKPIVIQREDIVKLLNKIQGRVEITIEEPEDGEMRQVHVKDLIGGEESFAGKFKIKEQDVFPERLLSRYVRYFDKGELMIPKTSLMIGNHCHVLKIKDKLKFDPMVMGKEYKQFITSVRAINPDEYDVQVYNKSLESEYTAHFTYDFLQSTDEARLQKYDSHQNTIYKFPANPDTMNLVLKYQVGDPKYLVIIEVEDDIAPFFVFFCSIKDMGTAGKIYTAALLFLEGAEDVNDVKVTTVDEDPLEVRSHGAGISTKDGLAPDSPAPPKRRTKKKAKKKVTKKKTVKTQEGFPTEDNTAQSAIDEFE